MLGSKLDDVGQTEGTSAHSGKIRWLEPRRVVVKEEEIGLHAVERWQDGNTATAARSPALFASLPDLFRSEHDCTPMPRDCASSQSKSSGVYPIVKIQAIHEVVDPGLLGRLDLLIEKAGGQRALAEAAGISPGTLTAAYTRVRSGGGLGTRTAQALAHWSGASLEWILSGTGTAPSWARGVSRTTEPNDRYADRPAAIAIMRGRPDLWPENVVNAISETVLKEGEARLDVEGWLRRADAMVEMITRLEAGRPPRPGEIAAPKRR